MIFLKNIIIGIIIGIANIIPGLSGATLAFILGIYQKSINIITRFDTKLLTLIKNCDFKKIYNHISLKFITSISIGIVISFIFMANLLDVILTNYPSHTWAYFFGIILGSIPYIIFHISKWSNKETLFFCIGLALSIILIFIPPGQENNNLIFIFICGMVGGVGMLVPGLSGSYLLVLLGNYKLLFIDTIQNLSSYLSNVFTISQKEVDITNSIVILGVFLLGQLVSVLAFSRLIKWLMKKKKNILFAILAGFISGSLIYIWPWKKHSDEHHDILINILSYPKFNDIIDVYLIIWILVGVITIITIEKWANNKQNV